MNEVVIDGSRISLRTVGPMGSWRVLRVEKTESVLSTIAGPYGLMEAPPQVAIAAYPIGMGEIIDRDGWLDVKALEVGVYSIEVARTGGVFVHGISEGSQVHFYWGEIDASKVIASKKLDSAMRGISQ